MTVFKNFFQVARRTCFQVALYIGIMVLISVLLIQSLGQNMDELTVSTQHYNLAILNRDADDPVSQGLADFLGQRTQKVEIKEGERAIQDALFWRDADYILEIPAGFGQALIAGQQKQILSYASPNDYTHRYVDAYLNRYLAAFALYQEQLPNESPASIDKLVQADLGKETEFMPAFPASQQAHSTTAWYFRYISYGLMAAIINGLGVVYLVLQRRDLTLRFRVSSTRELSRNAQLVLAGLVYASLIWLILVAVGMIRTKASLALMLTPRFRLIVLASFLYVLICMALALLLSNLTQKQNVFNGISNVIALGSSFLGGVFVPMEVLGEQVRTLGKVLPAYWYTTAIRAVGDVAQLSPASLTAYWQGMGILALMLGVLLTATLLVSKVKRQKGL